jgi:hypothetical protein
MGLINRAAVILRPKKPFVDWRNSIEVKDGRKPQFALNELRADPKLYLVRGFRDPEHVKTMILEDFDLYFGDQLVGCITGEDEWPQDRTVEMFRAWFDMEIIVWVDDTLDTEDIVEED